MDDRKFYECMERIPGTNKQMNLSGFVVDDSIPFLIASSAVKYALEINPDMKPGSDFVIHDKKRCRELARIMLPEVKRFRSVIENKRSEKSDEITKQAAERDAMNPKSIFENVEKELLQGRIKEGIGYHSGLCNCLSEYHNRIMELDRCSRLKDDVE